MPLGIFHNYFRIPTPKAWIALFRLVITETSANALDRVICEFRVHSENCSGRTIQTALLVGLMYNIIPIRVITHRVIGGFFGGTYRLRIVLFGVVVSVFAECGSHWGEEGRYAVGIRGKTLSNSSDILPLPTVLKFEGATASDG